MCTNIISCTYDHLLATAIQTPWVPDPTPNPIDDSGLTGQMGQQLWIGHAIQWPTANSNKLFI